MLRKKMLKCAVSKIQPQVSAGRKSIFVLPLPQTMFLAEQTVMLFDGLSLGKYERWRREILIQPLFKSSIYAIKIWNRYLI